MTFPATLTNATAGVTEIKAEHLNNLEAKVGIDGSTVPTSLDYLLKNSASVNPGHKHTVSAIQGLQATVNELNCLTGMDRNIYDEFELCLRVNRSNVTTTIDIIDDYNADGKPIANYGCSIRCFYNVANNVTISPLTGVFLTGRISPNCEKNILSLTGTLITGVHEGTGIVDTLTGLLVYTNMFGYGGSVNTGICLKIGTPARNYRDTDKTYGETFGLYISQQKTDYLAGRALAIYQAGSDDINQLNGNTGIGTDIFGTNARRVLALRDGVAPESSPANVVQLWANDRGGVNGKVGLHIRCEDGTQHVFADRTGIGTLTPAMFMDVSLPAVGSTSCFAVSSATASSYRTYLATLDGDRYAWLTNVRYTGSAYVKDNTNRGSWGVVHGCPTSDSAAACTINYFPVESTIPNAVFTVTGAGNVGIGQTSFGASAATVLALGSGTAPGSSPADAVQIYCADQAAGNACLHTRTENGAVIKLYQESALTEALTTITHTEPGTPDYAIQDLTNSGYGFATKDEGNTVLKVIANLQIRIAELESRLQNLGLLAS